MSKEGEDIEPTMYPKVFVWEHSPVRWHCIEQAIARFDQRQNCLDRQAIIISPEGPDT